MYVLLCLYIPLLFLPFHDFSELYTLQDLKAILDSGHDLPFPDGLLINGRGANGYTFTVDQGKQ